MAGNASRANGRKGGRPKGRRDNKTLDAEVRLQMLRQLVSADLEPMTRAQIAHAKGVSYMVLRHADGTFTRATDEKQIELACRAGAVAFQIFTQAPNTQAFTDLMNRTFGKPPERVEMTGTQGGPIELTWRSSK